MNCKPLTRSDGTKFEKCTCGCPSVSDVIIPHALLRRAATEKLSAAQVAQILGNPKRGIDAVRAAKNSMIGQGLITVAELSSI